MTKLLWPPEYNDVFAALDAALLGHQKRTVDRIRKGLDDLTMLNWYDHVDDVLDREQDRPVRWPGAPIVDEGLLARYFKRGLDE